MMLIVGGATEGRLAVKVADEAGKPFLYSTRETTQRVESRHGRRLCGALGPEAMTALCRREGVRLLVDAAHPFAQGLHRTVAAVSAATGIPVLRVERRYPPRDPAVRWCTDYDDAAARMERDGVRSLLALTGVRTIPRLEGFWRRHDCRFRVLDRAASVAEAESYGFPRERLLVFDAGADERPLIARLRPDAVLTKESGEEGYFPRKAAACAAEGVPLYAVMRPPLPAPWPSACSEEGLRKRIEELLPGFFELRSGYTTGTCAAAAAAAAAQLLATGDAPRSVRVVLPQGDEAELGVERAGTDAGGAWASVRKDGGDDPDATHGALVTAHLALAPAEGIRFRAGEGVGTVTLPGLGIEPGEPAINPTPRRMIARAIAPWLRGGATVTLSVEGGREIARRTFNPRLGIEGGISIIGTTGIVRPYSNEALVEALRREIGVARATGCERLVLNSGARSERFVRREYPRLAPQAFVHYGNFIGETLAAAAREGFARVTLGIMLGKAVKLAEGHLDTHSRKVTFDRGFLAAVAAGAGCSPATLARIGTLRLARELWELPDAERDRLLPALLARCRAVCAPLLPGAELTLLLIDDAGGIPYRSIPERRNG